jgi:uncharacterized protein YegL
MSDYFDPYHQWLGIPASDQPANHYRLLGIPMFEESAGVIENAADQRMGHLRTFQIGQHSSLSQKLLNEVVAAKVCLTTPAKKADYDQELRAHVQPGAPAPRPLPFNKPAALGPVASPNEIGEGRSTVCYEAEISRVNPMCFLFLIDQSGSMAEAFGRESGKTKAQGVADAVNRLVQTLVSRCAKGAYILDRYYIGVIGYGGELCLGEPLPVSVIGNSPLRVEERVKRVEDPETKLVEEHRVSVPIWFEPRAKGKTLMCAALQSAGDTARKFVSEHPKCFPPIIINITDGKPSDGDPRPNAALLRSVASQDGNALLFNIHISASGEKPILFPSREVGLPDDHARLLFRMSSLLPPTMLHQAQILAKSVSPEAVGFAFNADLASVITFLDIGTRVDSRIA